MKIDIGANKVETTWFKRQRPSLARPCRFPQSRIMRFPGPRGSRVNELAEPV